MFTILTPRTQNLAIVSKRREKTTKDMNKSANQQFKQVDVYTKKVETSVTYLREMYTIVQLQNKLYT